MPKLLAILSNPDDAAKLRMDREVKEINSAISTLVSHDFQCISVPAITIAEFPGVVILEKPTILHFSGHGKKSALFFEDKLGNRDEVSADALEAIFKETGEYIHCLVISACKSSSIAIKLKEYSPYIVSFPSDIEDDLSAAFSKTFYQVLSLGHTVVSAFNLATSVIASRIRLKTTLPRLDINKKHINYREKLFAVPTFTCQFNLGKNGRPVEYNEMYSLEFNVKDFPRNSSYIIYEFIDDTIRESNRFFLVKNLGSGSSCGDYLYGDIIIRIWIWIEEKNYGIGFQSTILEGLKNYYGKNIPVKCQAAYKNITSS